MSETKENRKGSRLLVIIAAVILMLGAAGWGAWTWHEQPSFCAICHEMQPYLDAYESSMMLAGAHAGYDVACLDCHEPTIEQQLSELVVHIKGEFEEPLSQRDFGDDFCLDCHLENSTHTSWEDVIALTEGREDELGINPHDPYHNQFECGTCHIMHEMEPGNICIECHVPGVPLDEIPSF